MSKAGLTSLSFQVNTEVRLSPGGAVMCGTEAADRSRR